MYNFRYHLVTIVSIFAALALGLLLGVAVTGSDLVRDASSNLAESLTKQFDELNSTNEALNSQLQNAELLNGELFSAWRAERLKGRTVVILTRTPAPNDRLATELSTLINQSGGIPIVVRIDPAKGFNLEDERIATELKQLVPEVEGETYETTLARALTDEWSFSVRDSDGSVLSALEVHYPLTTHLVEKKLISVTVSYKPLLDAFNADGLAGAALSSQHFAYGAAEERQLPYGVNGVINTAVIDPAPENPQISADVVAQQIALQFVQKGTAGELPYLIIGAKVESQATTPPDDETTEESDGETTGEESTAVATEEPSSVEELPANANYYALLTQEGEGAELMRSFAQENDLACVLSPFDSTGRYSIIALLSGAERGVYGLDIIGVAPFPSAPLDPHGAAAFAPAP
jgi:hypothetical protein